MGNDGELAPVCSQPRKSGPQRAAHPGLRKVFSSGPQLALGPEQDAETPDWLFAAWPDVSLGSLKSRAGMCVFRGLADRRLSVCLYVIGQF